MPTDNLICPHCGADTPRRCELEDDLGACPWSESGQYDDAVERDRLINDPDRLREDRDERRRVERMFPDAD